MSSSMGVACLLLLQLFIRCLSTKISAVGTNTFWPVIRQWANAYESVDPTFEIDFHASSAFDSVEEMTTLSSIDFAMIDFLKLNATQHQSGFLAFPLLQTTLVLQINLPNISSIVLDREVLPRIYMGNITNWSDPAIIRTNPNISFPNATIKRFFREGSSSFNHLWTSGLSAWSDEWSTKYGISMNFPDSLKGPDCFPESNVLFINSAVAVTPYSIGYVPYFLVKRDPSLTYAKLIHKWTGRPIVPDQLSLVAENWVSLNERLEGPYDIDSTNPQAWPIASYIHIMIDTSPKDCDEARSLYKFFHWALIDFAPRHATTFLGCSTLTPNISSTVLQYMSKIQCNGQAIGAFEPSESKGSLELSVLILSILFFVGGCILSGLHVYYFSKSAINMVYSLVFIVGTALTLVSPVFWYASPTDSICGARVWTGSIGFAILLATMFSRTWQLNDIYRLQKENMDTLRAKKTAHNTLVQLGMTLGGVIAANVLILIIWTSVDPLKANWVIVDEYRLTGYWTCSGEYTKIWLLLELIFFLLLLCFGIYVIYRTWSFQRQALLTETRWVLIALYNIVMNLAAIVPLLAFLNVTEVTLAKIVILSIDISGGSIVCAVLVPRVITKLELSTHGSSKPGGGPISPTKTGSHNNQKREYSRTPEDELAKRLQEPLPLKLSPLTEKGEPCELELQPLSLNQSTHHDSDRLEISSSHQLLEGASSHGQVYHATIQEEEEDQPRSSKKKTAETLEWSRNPIREEDLPGTPDRVRRKVLDTQ